MRASFTKTIVFFLIHTAVIAVCVFVFYHSARWCFGAMHSMLTFLGFVLNAIGTLVISSASAIMITLFIRRYSLSPVNYYWMIPLFNIPLCFLLVYGLNLTWDLAMTLFIPGLVLTSLFSWLSYRKTAPSGK